MQMAGRWLLSPRQSIRGENNYERSDDFPHPFVDSRSRRPRAEWSPVRSPGAGRLRPSGTHYAPRAIPRLARAPARSDKRRPAHLWPDNPVRQTGDRAEAEAELDADIDAELEVDEPLAAPVQDMREPALT